MLHVNQENGIVNGLAYRARCANPAGSTTTLQLPALSGFSNDYFNNYYYIQVIKNNNSAGNAPEGDEPRKVTDYVSATGTFTTDAFSANVEVEDEVLLIHESIASIPGLLSNLIVADFIIADRDDFDVADADANTERWDVEYITGTEGGSADINTTTARKLMVLVDPDVTPTEARYAVSHALPFYADYLTTTVDLDCTWGTDSATAKAAGMIISAGSAYDATNYLAVERQKGTGVNRFQVSGKLNNVAISSTNVNSTDDAVALKVQRYDNVWRFYYSTIQSPNEDWTLIAQVEDPSVYMTNQVTLYLQAYSVGSADGETAQADFDNFRYYVGSGGGGQYIAGDYSSAWVSRDVDGNVFERLEDIKEDIRGTGGIASFPGAANAGDGVSLAEVIRAILTSMVGGDDFDAYTNISNTANASLNAIAQKFAAVIGIDSTNTFSSTIQGGARTTIEAALDALATYFAASGAAMALQVNNNTARTNLEQALSDYFAAVGCDGTNVFNPTIQGAAQTTLDAALAQLAVYFAAAGAAMSVQLNNQTARTNLEQILEDYFVLVGVDGINVLTNINNSANATFNAVWQKFAALWGADGINVFNPTIAGSARVDLDAALGALAGQLSPSAAAISVTMNNGAAKTTFEEIWEAWLVVVGVDGINQFTNISNSANTTFNAVFQKFAAVLGIDAANAFNPSMFGATPATVEAAFTALGTALGAEYDGTPDVYDTIVTGLDSSAITANVDGSALERLEDLSLAASRAVADLVDYDDFDVADADANNERWDVGYLNGTEGGSADISTTTAGKLMAKVDPDATPTAAAYGAHLSQPMTSKYFTAVVDVDATFGTPSGSWATVGMRVSPAAYDANNVVYLQRQNSTAGVQNRLCAGAVFASANQGEVYFTTADAAVAFKIERFDNVWRLYYSLMQYPNYVWVLLTQYEDAAEGMDSLQAVYLDAYSPGSADAETAQGDFDNFKLYINPAGLQQAVSGDYDSSAVAADEDGSVLERLEQIQEAVNKGTGSALPANKSLLDIIGAAYVDAGGGLGTDSVLSDLGDIHTHIDDVDTDLGEPGDGATINGSVHSKLNGIIAALEITAAAGGKFEVDGTEGLWTQLKEIPASDGSVTWNNTALASVNAEVDTALNTIVPASPTAGSVNDVLSKAAGANTFDKATDSLEMLSDKAGAFTGDGGADQNDSVKASLDLAHTDLDTIITDTEKIYDVALGVAPVDGSLASFIATGGTALGTRLPVNKSLYDGLTGGIDAVNRGIGNLQIAITTESLNQVAASYDLLTGTTQAVILEKLNVKMPTGAAGGTLTSISIQTDDATPGVIISAVNGAVANLTSEADISWTGSLVINVGTKIQLTIAGGAHGSAYDVTVIAQSRAVVSGGYLA